MFGLGGRVALVTGGASGLGHAWSAGLAAAGAHVVIADIDVEAGERVTEVIRRQGGSAGFVSTDVTDAKSVQQTVQTVSAQWNRLDVLINSAGAAHRSSVEDFPVEALDRILTLNLRGSYLMGQAAGRVMLDQRSGSIINVASIGAFVAYPHSSAYLASKGGVVQMTKAFALEWIDRGVRVNAIAPGLCETPLLEKVLSESGSSSTTDFIHSRMLREGLLEPDDLVGAAIFLASDAASKVTGQVVVVDDGYLAV